MPAMVGRQDIQGGHLHSFSHKDQGSAIGVHVANWGIADVLGARIWSSWNYYNVLE